MIRAASLRAPGRALRWGLALGAMAVVLGSTGEIGSAAQGLRRPFDLRAATGGVAGAIGGAPGREGAERPPRAPLAPAVTPIEFAPWHGTSFGGYMAPKWGAACAAKRPGCFVGADGGVDMVFHFNAAMVVEKEWKESGANAIVVSASFGSFGSGPYADALSDPGRFDRMTKETLSALEAQLPKDPARPRLHPRRVGLVAWSAGFAAVSKILGVDRYYAMTDSVVLLDGLHASYKSPDTKTGGQGDLRVDVSGLSNFTRFAKDARDGKKAFVITHSSIVPPEYASSTEATSAVLREAGARRTPVDRQPCERDMVLVSRVDDRGLHVRGFDGTSQRTHMDHLHLVGPMVKQYVAPRWR